MNRVVAAQLLLLGALVATVLPVAAADRVVDKASPPLAPATLTAWNRPIFVFRAPLRQVSPAGRAARAAERIAALPSDLPSTAVRAEPATLDGVDVLFVYGGIHLLFVILPADLDPSLGETLQSAGDQAVAQVRAVLEARAEQRRLPALLRAIAVVVAATGLAVLLLWTVGRATGWVLRRMAEALKARATNLLGVDVWPLLYALERWLVTLTAWAASLTLVYLWLTFVLMQFPYSRPLGQRLGTYVVDLLHELGAGALQAIPGLFAVIVIFLATRFAVRLADTFFRGVERGAVVVGGLQPDTVGATRRIATALMWIFALTVAYQYIPGSESDAFKAVGVFAGLMLSLGSAGLVSQFMSGLMTVYARALRPGELVRTGDVVGVVSQVGLLSTKVRTATREEVTIPNSVLAGLMVTNYSRLAGEAGAVVATTVTIGYDVPWRQVHALLLTAAGRTSGALAQPQPYVLQRALSDYAVEYELRVGIERVEERFRILSDLHSQIQDAFNEYGVQIMSPKFEAQPTERVVVPTSRWFEPPATRPHDATPGGASADTRGEVMKRMSSMSVTLALTALLAAAAPAAAQAPAPAAVTAPDRTVLPIPPPQYSPITEVDARKATPPPRFEVRPPRGAPNVVIVLIDDMGFGQPSTFGGGVAMPTLDRLAAGGLRYNQFHTTALCSPTRVALKYGRNHHSANAGSVMEIATAFPGNQGQVPNSVAPLAEMLRLNGYGTAAFGKWHETAPWEVSVSGPFDRWPTRQGFDKFYGFIGGETNQWAPLIYDGLLKVEPPRDPKYHFTTDMTNQAIAWVRAQQSLTPDRPFFVYFAPGATHAPHHVPKEWIAKYAGKFDGGWDRYREATLARQIELGVVPPGTKLAPRSPAIKDWDALSADEKRLFARQMEVFAAFGEHTDHEIGRLAKAIEELGVMDNTLFIYIAGDNGASAEGSMTGLFNETSFFNGVPEQLADVLRYVDRWGDPTTYPHYAVGWAIAGNTPFAWAKQVASSYGGTRNGMVIHWPKGIKTKGDLRTQWHHVVDVAPTVLEAAGLPFPRVVNGTRQKPFEGVSLAYTFNDARAKDRHRTQYFEIGGNRAIYHDGWLAGTVHRAPWEPTPRATLDQDRWELYDTRQDFSLATDLAAKQPQKLREMQALFMKEAVKYSVLPIDDRSIERFNAAIAGRPDLMGGRTSLTVYDGMTGMMENTFINVKNRSHAITAEVEIPSGGANGVVIAQAGRFAGWSLYFKDGKPAYVHNWIGRDLYTVAAQQPVAPGKATVRMDFVYDGGGLGKGGAVTLSVNGQKVAEGRIARTVPMVFSGDEGTDVGVDEATNVTDAYKEGDNRFTGRIHKITIEVK